MGIRASDGAVIYLHQPNTDEDEIMHPVEGKVLDKEIQATKKNCPRKNVQRSSRPRSTIAAGKNKGEKISQRGRRGWIEYIYLAHRQPKGFEGGIDMIVVKACRYSRQ